MIFNAYSESNAGLFGLSLCSAGHVFARQGRRIFRPKGREDWLLFYVAKGTERFYFDRAVDGDAGSFVIFRPGEAQHHEYLPETPGEFFYAHFRAPEHFDLMGLETSKLYSPEPSALIRDKFGEILEELQRKQPNYEQICAALLLELLGLLARRVAHAQDPNLRYNDKISFTLQQMNREYAENRSLDDYAALCGMSKFHFLRIFKQITGTSPMEYRDKLRIEHAKILLEDLSLPVNEVGFRVGYSSPSYFCDTFRKKTGTSPSRYRKSLKE